MKIFSHLLVFSCFHACIWRTVAFTVSPSKTSSRIKQQSTPPGPPSLKELTPIFPTSQLELVQGGGTIRTFQMPEWAERCQMIFMTDGRPLKFKAELMRGPVRTTHKLNIDIEDGSEAPYRATLKFKKDKQVLRVITADTLEFPILVGVFVPPPEVSEQLAKNTEMVWDAANSKEKQLIQGGSVGGGVGAYRYWSIPQDVESVQLVGWSRDTGKKSFRVQIEVLQGPNCIKQSIFLQCGGGSQPYHAIIKTPGPGCVIGIQNKKFVEDGLVQIAIIPYEKAEHEVY